jgi:spore maturation protein CgeB
VKILCVHATRDDDPLALSVASHYAPFVAALSRLGHVASHVDCGEASARRDLAGFNRDLVRRVMSERPDALLLAHDGVEVWTETVDLLRGSCDTLLIRWSRESAVDYATRMRPVIPHYDLFVTTSLAATHLARRDGFVNVFLSQWAADADRLTPPLPAAACEFPLVYAGPATPRRVRWIKALKARGMEVACFGPGWSRAPLETVDLAAVVRRSIMTLDFAATDDGQRGLRVDPERPLSPRTFEIPASGGMLVSEAGESLKRFFLPDAEIGVFASVDELETVIRKFRMRPDLRDAAARAAFDRVRLQHTYDRRLAEVLAKIRHIGPALVAQVADAETVMRRFERIARAHRAGWLTAAARQALVVSLIPLFGRKRARSAARALVFRASLRLQGARAFGAAGLSGRLFHR